MMVRVCDVPFFASTEDAIRYGKQLRGEIAPDKFQALVGIWIIAQRAAADAVNPQAKVHLATRSQTCREAVEAFLDTWIQHRLTDYVLRGTNSTTGHRAQGDPATGSDDVPSETAVVEVPVPSTFDPLELGQS